MQEEKCLKVCTHVHVIIENNFTSRCLNLVSSAQTALIPNICESHSLQPRWIGSSALDIYGYGGGGSSVIYSFFTPTFFTPTFLLLLFLLLLFYSFFFQNKPTSPKSHLRAQSSSVSAASYLPCLRQSAPRFFNVVVTVGESTFAAATESVTFTFQKRFGNHLCASHHIHHKVGCPSYSCSLLCLQRFAKLVCFSHQSSQTLVRELL